MIHPLFVHFPIGMLVVYGLLELIRFRFVLRELYWFYIKASLSIFGTLLAYFTLATGDGAEHYIRQTGNDFQRSLVDVHAGFAGTTTIIFSIAAFAYLIEWLHRIPKTNNFFSLKFPKVYEILMKISLFIRKPFIIMPLAVLGIILMTITGGLGATMVYGPDVDPIVHAIYSFVSPFIGK